MRLRTAILDLNVTLSCHGGAFCREDVLRPDASDAMNEAIEDCARRGGRLERTTCPRADVVASCGATLERGPVVVFTYAQGDKKEEASAVSTMSDLCEATGGELVRAPSLAGP